MWWANWNHIQNELKRNNICHKQRNAMGGQAGYRPTEAETLWLNVQKWVGTRLIQWLCSWELCLKRKTTRLPQASTQGGNDNANTCKRQGVCKPKWTKTTLVGTIVMETISEKSSNEARNAVSNAIQQVAVQSVSQLSQIHGSHFQQWIKTQPRQWLWPWELLIKIGRDATDYSIEWQGQCCLAQRWHDVKLLIS